MKIILKHIYKDDAKMLYETSNIDISEWQPYEFINYITGLLSQENTIRIIIEEKN